MRIERTDMFSRVPLPDVAQAIAAVRDDNPKHAALVAACMGKLPANGGEAHRIWLMLTLGGDIVAQWESELQGDYRAHLACYSVADDKLQLLQLFT